MNLNGCRWLGGHAGHQHRHGLEIQRPESRFPELPVHDSSRLFQGLSSIQANGKMALSGFIKGRYNAASMPGFGLKLDIDNGRFKYPSLPAEVRSVFVNLAVENPTVFLIIRTSTFPDWMPTSVVTSFRSRLVLKTPVSDPDLDAMMKGRINLDNVKKFVPLEREPIWRSYGSRSGTEGTMSSIDRKQYDQFKAAGVCS